MREYGYTFPGEFSPIIKEVIIMNKLFLTSAMVLALTVSALAFQDETHNGRTVAVPGATKSRGVLGVGFLGL